MLFENAVCQSANKWVTIQDISPKQLTLWRRQARNCGVDPDMNRLRTLSNRRSEAASENPYFKKQMIPQARKIVNSLISNSTNSFLYLLTDSNGILQDFYGTQEIMKKLDRMNLSIGTSFALADAGVNAISLSMLLKERIYLCGSDHDIHLFHDWACICSPIVLNEEIVGYADFSFYIKVSPQHAMMILGRLVDVMQKQRSAPQEIYTELDELLKSYRLSPREREVARLWCDNRGVLYISTTLGITEGTVRNFIKKIYSKVGVKSKVELCKKLLFTHPTKSE